MKRLGWFGAALLLGATLACSGQPGLEELGGAVTATELTVVAHHDLTTRVVNPPPPVPARLDGEGAYAFAPVTVETARGAYVGFDRATRQGAFEVLVEDPSGARHRLVESDRHQAHAALADGPGGLWFAFEEGGSDWGQGGALRRTRRVVFGWFDATTSPPTATTLATPFTDEVEAPTLVTDAGGRPWLFVRALKRAETFGTSENDEAANRRVAWVLQATALTDTGWTAPITLPDSSGPEDGALELSVEGERVVAEYFTDRRAARFVDDQVSGPWDRALPGPGGWHAAVLTLDASAGAPVPGPGAGAAACDPAASAAPPARADDGLVWGDLHRHTDASRCKMDEDGDLLDAYRYALGTARLDFMAVTNHFQHMRPETFEREVLTAEAFDALEGFTAFVGYERALPIGHWTMVASGTTARPLADGVFAPYRPRFLWDEHPASDWLAIPHQLTDRAAPLTWDQVGALDPVVEVFQSRRGAYEARAGWRRDLGGDPDAKWAQDYLGEGRTLGFVASSDHATTLSAFTGVRLAPGEVPSRETIVEAIRARHTVAASVRGDFGFALRDADGASFGPGDVAPVPAKPVLAIDAWVPGLVRLDVVHGRPGDRAEVVPAAPTDGEPRVFLRVGRAEKTRTVVLTSDAVQIAREEGPRAFGLEADDQLSAANADEVVLESHLDLRDEDGFFAPVTWDPEADAPKLMLSVRSPGKQFHKEFTLTKRLDADTELFWAAGARADLRVDRTMRLPTEGLKCEVELPTLAPGDWLYLRGVTRSGDILWTSPLFVR